MGYKVFPLRIYRYSAYDEFLPTEMEYFYQIEYVVFNMVILPVQCTGGLQC